MIISHKSLVVLIVSLLPSIASSSGSTLPGTWQQPCWEQEEMCRSAPPPAPSSCQWCYIYHINVCGTGEAWIGEEYYRCSF